MKVALSKILGDKDIVIGSLNEIIEAKIDIPKQIQNILKKPVPKFQVIGARMLGKSMPEAKNIAVKNYYNKQLGPNSPHPSAIQIKKFTEDIFYDYKKFTFVRNPYDRVISDYKWRKKMTKKNFSFDEYLSDLETNNFNKGYVHKKGISNWDMISINDDLIIDTFGRFENLTNDFSRILSQLSIPHVDLGHEKKSIYTKDNRIYYSQENKKRVKKIFKKEIEAFNYDCPY